MVHYSMLQVLDDMVSYVSDGFCHINHQLQVLRDKLLQVLRADMEKHRSSILYLESHHMNPEYIEPIRRTLKELQKQEAAFCEMVHKDVRKAADSFKQALKEKLLSDHPYLSHMF